MSIQPFKAALGRNGGMTVSSKASFVSDVNAQVAQMVNNYTAFVENIELQSGEIVLEALEPTFEKSQLLVPVDTGDLQESGYLVKQQSKGFAQVEMGYARGGTPDYAVAVHEDMDVHHAAPTQAKFLQQPLEQDSEEIQGRIEAGFRLAAGFDGGVR